MKPPVFTQLDQGIVCIDALYTAPQVACCYLVRCDTDYVLIETGTARSVDNILATLDALGIDRAQLRYIIPTHAHLDHAGGAGALMARLPAAELLIHPRGARHLIDPGRLVQSSRQVYGDELFHTLHGEIIAVEESRVRILADGERLRVQSREFLVRHTRGHAEHHFCIWDEQSRGWFSGDMFGVSYQRQRFAAGSFVMPATTPTQFDPALYAQSLQDLVAQRPARFYLTHFSELEYHEEQLQGLLRQLERYAACGKDFDGNIVELEARLAEITREELGHLLPAEQARKEVSKLSMDLKLNAQGIAWWSQQSREQARGAVIAR